MTTPENPSFTNRDPKAGCLIMIIGAVIFGGLILYTVSLPFRQSSLMEEFTDSAPSDPVPPLTLGSKGKLDKKLQDFHQERLRNTTSTIILTTEDINCAIANYAEFKDLKHTFAISQISSSGLHCQISFPLRGRPFSGDQRHLNGTMYATPEILNDELVLQVSQISPSKGTIPEEFLAHFQPYRIMSPYSEHEHLGRAMYAAQKITLQEGSITIQIDNTRYIDDAAIYKVESKLKSNRKRSTVMTLSSFLLVGFLFIILIRRRNARSVTAFTQ